MGMRPVARYLLSSNFYSLLSSRYSLLVVGLSVMGPGSSFCFCIFSPGSLSFLSWGGASGRLLLAVVPVLCGARCGTARAHFIFFY